MSTANIVLASESTLFDARAALAQYGKPWCVNHRTLITVIDAMRSNRREELVRYAGASYRDEVAWELCKAWLAQPEMTESVLKHYALKACGTELSPEDIRAANPGMR